MTQVPVLSLSIVGSVISRHTALDKMAEHVLSLCMGPCRQSCTSYVNDSKQEAMVSMDMKILTFETQVGLNDKLYICLLDALC